MIRMENCPVKASADFPGMNGVDICRAIRTESSVPIIMLTAKTDTVDVVLGLESGADRRGRI